MSEGFVHFHSESVRGSSLTLLMFFWGKFTSETTRKLDVLGLCIIVGGAHKARRDSLRMVTRFAWIAQRFVSSKREIRYASVASCRAPMAEDWKRMSDLKSW